MATPSPNIRKRSSPVDNNANETPRKKRNATPEDYSISKMASRLKGNEYSDLHREMKHSCVRGWNYEFRRNVSKKYGYMLTEARTIISQYQEFIQENDRLRQSLEEKIAELSSSEAFNKTLGLQIEDQKTTISRQREDIQEYVMENAKLKTEIKNVLLDNGEKVKQIKEEEDKRKMAEKATEEAKETLEKQLNESLPQHDLSELTEKIDGLKDDVNKLQNTTADEVQELRNLSTNMCNMFPAKNEGPLWIVSLPISQSIFYSAQENPNNFISLYLKELFCPAELILPTKQLNKNKKEEFEMVFLHFFKRFSSDLSEKLFNQELESLRNKQRLNLYKTMGKHEIVGITLLGTVIFYSKDSMTGKMMPYSNASGTPLIIQKFANIYGIPFENQEDEFLIVVEKSKAKGVVYRRIIISSGYVQDVYTHGTKSKK